MTNTGEIVLGFVPARAGSKGVSKKNVAPTAGKPLIAYTIETAKSAESLDRIIVSTDSSEIASIALTYGAEVPFLRPKELAQDDTPGIAPILHAIQWLDDREGYRPDYVMVLQPTSPLRTAEDIKAALTLMWERQADAVVSVCPVSHHPYWTKIVTEDGRLVDFLTLEGSHVRRQDLPPVYALNGAIYLARRDVLLKERRFYTERTYAYVMPEERSLDIDTIWDLYLVDLVLSDRKRHESNQNRRS